MPDTAALQPPSPRSAEDIARWDHTRLRRRMLSGLWHQDAKNRMVKQLGTVRADAIQDPELSSNPFASICRELAVLYDEAPEVSLDGDEQSTEVMRGLLEEAAWGPRMQSVQRKLVGLREMLVRPDVDQDGVLSLRPVTPDHVVASARPDRPDEPAMVRELKHRDVGGREQWTWDEYDITNPAEPRFRVLSADLIRDLTEKVYGQQYEGAQYPWRFSDDTPFLPYVLYHAELGDQLWDAWEGRELVDGTLSIAVLRSYYAKCVRDASWRQRWAIGVQLPSDASAEDHAVNEVVADPATVVMFDVDPQLQGGAQIGQWDNPTDLGSLYDSIQAWARDLAQWAGLSPSDFARISGDPRSGYALSLTSQGKKAASRKFLPAAKRGDQQFLRIVAAMYNRATSGGIPERGWTIEYRSLPPSPAEVREHRQHVRELLAEGLITRVQAYVEMHGVTEAEARSRLAEISRERAADF